VIPKSAFSQRLCAFRDLVFYTARPEFISPAHLIRRQKLDPADYEAKIGQFYDLNAGLAYALVATLVPIAPWLFDLVYGQGFDGAASVFQIHLLACMFVFLGVARSSYLINEGFTSFDLFATSTGAILNVVLNLFLIPEYGAHGAAVSPVISQAV
jgi:O-antigen/teichoic acid export membrane protein